jgi:hypothetical protein
MAFPDRDLAFEPICRNEFVTEPADSADAAIVPFQLGSFENMECHASGVSDLRLVRSLWNPERDRCRQRFHTATLPASGLHR